MTIESALQEIFKGFSPDTVSDFFQSLEVNTLRLIKEDYDFELDTSQFATPFLFGEINLKNEDLLAIFTIKVENNLTERSGKKAQYDLAKKILKGDRHYSAGIFIFYDDKNDFRFSLVYGIPEPTGQRNYSSFRRYTYFVSRDQSNKTFLLQIQQADFSSLERLKEAFSVEKVTKAFYAELQNWYFWAMDRVVFPDDEDKGRESRNAKNLIRLITRIIFIWFMKEKKLIPTTLFDKFFVDHILNYNDSTGSTYYKAILQNLFFATLNTPMRKDNSASRLFVEEAQKHGFISDAYLQQGYYRYSRFIKDREKFLKEFDNIPFLNGGLFECLDKKVDGKEIRIDCFSDNPKNESRLKVPDDLFFLEKESEVNLSYIESGTSRKVRGLFPILKSYNFTTDENTPIDEEIALDPELLGKVFENLLASYNPETATTARNATGSYYTPREIVDYMVTESLVQYLKQNIEHNQNQVNNQGSSPCKGEVSHSDGGVNSNPTPPTTTPPFEKGESLMLPNPTPPTTDVYNLPELKSFRKELRKNLTPAEAKLWTALKNKQLQGRRFRRQYSVGKYILDFYCPEEKLAVELDGAGHFSFAGSEYDVERDAFMQYYDVKVLRFENKLVWEDLEYVLEEIKKNFGWFSQNKIINQNQVNNQGSSPCKGEVSRSDGGVNSNPMVSSLEARLRKLFVYDDDITDFNDREKNAIIEALSNVKILDPACGSGAFPMGILHKLVLALHKLDPDNKIWKKRLLDKIAVEIRAEVEKSLENKSLDYIRKLGLIEHCIFGVDIQEIAIQISKLRFFISLLIEQEVDDSKENRDIRALPNLETKFVAANTLIGLDTDLYLESDEVKFLKNKLFEIREKLFYTNKRTEKYELQKELTSLRKQLKIELEKNGFPNDKAEKITQFDPFDQNTHADFFDPEWMFGVNHGFDIVIGNPPYIQLQKAYNSKIKFADLYKEQGYQTFDRTGDIYCLFYEKGINLLNDKGHLIFITSNKWMRAGYGEKLRKFFLNYNPKILIDLGPNVFESATVDTNILIIQKTKNQNQLYAVKITEKNKDNLDFARFLQENGVILSKLTPDAWFIGDDAEQRLKEKIEQIGKPLKEWDVKIYYGIKTGLNEAFIIDNNTRDKILANCQDEAEKERTKAIIKPILRGRDIKRYYYQWAGIWVIGTFPSLRLNIDDYPAIKKYFLDHFDIRQLEQSGEKYPELGFNARKKTGNKWFETQDQIGYYHEFEKEKVVWCSVGETFYCFINKDYYILDTNYFTTSLNKWQLGVLNSKLIINYINSLDTLVGSLAYRHYKYNFEKIPIPPIGVDNEPIVHQIEVLVDKILEAKKTENYENSPDTTPYEREIDHLVYKLYNLTDSEIKIIERQA